MNFDRTISYFQKPDLIDKIVRNSRKNGYFDHLKDFGSRGLPFDVSYKKKVHSYYKQKITKPFSLFQQPQYRRQLRFNSDFNAFVRSIPEFERIQEESIEQMPEMTDIQKQVHSETLLYDVCRKCDVSPENMKKRKNKQTIPVYRQQIHNDATFPTKINLTESLRRKQKKNETDSRFAINLNSGHRSLSKTSYNSIISPTKTQEKLNLSKKGETVNVKAIQSRRSDISINQSKDKLSANSSQKLYINQAVALQTLNQLTLSDHKMKNFRLSKQKFHQLLTKRYGNQIITQFFQIQSSQDIPSILNIFRQILSGSPKLLLILTFLTLDINQDGLITQDQLNTINNSISIDCQLTQDISKIIQYCNSGTQRSNNSNNGNGHGHGNFNFNVKCQPDLPLEFVKQPTFKDYLRIMQENKEIQTGNVRGIFRLFSFQGDQNQKIFGGNLPALSHRSVDLNKKKIRINFEVFQKIFGNEKPPGFIKDLVEYILGKRYNKLDDDSPRKLTKKRERQFKIKNMMETSLKQKIQFLNTDHSHQSDQTQISKVHEILHKMYQDQKSLATVHYN